MTAKQDHEKFMAAMEHVTQGLTILSNRVESLRTRAPMWAVVSLVVNGVFLGATLILLVTP